MPPNTELNKERGKKRRIKLGKKPEEEERKNF